MFSKSLFPKVVKKRDRIEKESCSVRKSICLDKFSTTHLTYPTYHTRG